MLVIVYGAMHGVFTLTTLNILQHIPEEKERASALIFVQVISKIGMLGGALFLLMIGENMNRFVAYKIFISICMFLAFIVSIRPNKKILASILSFLFVTFSAHALNVEKIIRMPVGNLPRNFDPAKLLFIEEAIVSGQIFESLYDYDGNNSLQPILVSKHIISPDGKRLKIEIQSSKKFSDGQELTAKTVELSLKRAIITLGKSISWAVGDLEGFEEFITNPRLNYDKIAIRAISEREIEFILKRPSPLFLQMLSMPYFAITKEVNSKLIGTGAYVLKEFDDLRVILRHRSPVTDSKSPEEVHFYLETKTNTLEHMVASEVVNFVDISDKKVTIPEGFRLEKYDVLSSVFLFLNTTNPKFRHREKRCEFLEKFEASFRSVGYEVTDVFSAFPFSWSLQQVAKESSGRSFSKYFSRKDKISVLWINSGITYFSKHNNAKIKSILHDQGIYLEFKETNTKDLGAILKAGKFDAALVGWIPDILDPDSLLYPLLGTGQQYNFSNFSSPVVDSLLRLERSISDTQSRMLVFQQLFEEISIQCPVKYLGKRPSKFILSKHWRAPKLSLLGLYHVRFSQFSFLDGAKP